MLGNYCYYIIIIIIIITYFIVRLSPLVCLPAARFKVLYCRIIHGNGDIIICCYSYSSAFVSSPQRRACFIKLSLK